MPSHLERVRSGVTLQAIRTHVQINENLGGYCRITEERFAAALAEWPHLTSLVDVSFGRSAADLRRSIRDVEVLLTGTLDPRDLAAQFTRLKWVQSIFAGVEDLSKALPADVLLTNASGVHAAKSGQYGIAAIIMLNNALPRFIFNQQRKHWEPIFTSGLEGKTVVIVGTGDIGLAVAAQAKHFAMRTVGISRSGHRHAVLDEAHDSKQLNEALQGADFLVVALPLTPETRGIIGKRQLDCLPNHAGVVNLGRAQVMDYQVLANKLNRGELSGAFLDVFPEEPLPSDSPLWNTSGAIISPHCAIDDARTYVSDCLRIFFRNFDRYVRGVRLENLVNRTLHY